MRYLPLLGVLLVAAKCPCDPLAEDCDHDGVEAGVDCDNEDPNILGPEPWFADCDLDGVSGPSMSEPVCFGPEVPACDGDGRWLRPTEPSGDCDDFNPDAVTDANWYPDCDGDGLFGEPLSSCGAPSELDVAVCGAPDIVWTDNTPLALDCDDTDGDVIEAVDWFPDCDGDAFVADAPIESCGAPADLVCEGAAPTGGWLEDPPPEIDCDDFDPDRFPGNPETSGDGVDSDCDGLDDLVPNNSAGTFAAPRGTGDTCTAEDPCATIQQAMAQAVALDLPTVFVAEGAFTFNSPLTLAANIVGGLNPVSWGPAPGATEIGGSASPSMLVATSGSYRLSDLTFNADNAGLRIQGTAVIEADNVIVNGQVRVDDGALIGSNMTINGADIGLFLGDGTIDIRDSFVTHTNRALGTVYPVSLDGTGTLTMTDCVINGYGGVQLRQGHGHFERVTVQGDRAGFYAGGGPGASMDILDSHIAICNVESAGLCKGVQTDGLTHIDGTEIHVGPLAGNAYAVGVWSNGDGDVIVSDSVVTIAESEDSTNVAFRAAGTGDSVMTVAGVYARADAGEPNSALFRVERDRHLVIVNTVLDPPTAPGNAGIRWATRGTTAMYDLRWQRSAGGGDFRREIIFHEWSVLEVFNDCDIINADGFDHCAAAQGLSVGPAGFTDADNGDYTLVSGAFCRDAGMDLTSFVDLPWRTFDLYGAPRDSDPDCGPSEF